MVIKNIAFGLTIQSAYIEYAFDVWSTGASGFTLKPLTADGVREQLKNLRYPF